MYIYMYIYRYTVDINIYIYAVFSIYIFMDNGTNGKRKFVFPGRQTINGNRCLLFQQTCPSEGVRYCKTIS